MALASGRTFQGKELVHFFDTQESLIRFCRRATTEQKSLLHQLGLELSPA
jgi:hypothetical protein